ncbi:MAG TPA: response regulator, partial [Spirochaetales bacterium]|nr:response regulator [Spirochaetales bacterium]
MARIFFVEDNEGLREAATGYLKLDDHEVVEFGRLQGVLEALRVREPDLIILDVMLPDGNGFQLARSIRRDYNIPIIFLTAKTSESDRITGFEVGGDDYVLKPFSARELNLRVKAVLKRTGKEIAESRVSERLVFKESELVMDSKAHLALLEIDKDETNKV